MKRIKNNRDWFIAGIIERSETVGAGRANPLRRGLTWLNHILIHASSPEEAYEKAVEIGKIGSRSRYKTVAGRTVQWRFVGVAELLPVYEDIAHGSEIAWSDLGHISARKAEAMARTRKQLVEQAMRTW